MVFIGAMLGAAGLSLVRILLVVAALPKPDFATYAAVTATGAFLGNIVSFGAVEGTVKAFPRLAASGRLSEMREQAHGLVRVLAVRSLGVGVPIVLLGAISGSHLLVIAGSAFLFALSVSYISLVASMQRAVGSSALLAGGSVFRAVLTLVVVVTTAHFAGLVWTLLAEAASAIAGGYFSEKFFLRGTHTAGPANAGKERKPLVAAADTKDGIRVFLTYTAVSVPFYLDRLYVTATLGSDQAAEYALLALFPMAASLLIAAISQRVGPDAIKKALAPGGKSAALRYILNWCGISVAIWIALLTAAAVMLKWGWVPAGLAKYDIEAALLVPVGILGALYISGLLEFLLLAFDQERRMLAAALSYLAAVIAVGAGAAIFHADLYGLIWLLAAARLFYCTLLAITLRSALALSKAPPHV